jgi:hypothetical protein
MDAPYASLANRAIMPSPRSDEAPYFSGERPDLLEDFLYEYEQLATDCGLTGKDKVERLTLYIANEWRGLWRSLDGYATHNWDVFRQSLEEIYITPSIRKRLSGRALYHFVGLRRWSRSRSRGNKEDEVHLYYKYFLSLSKPLLDSERLTYKERDIAFWNGFDIVDRTTLFSCLVAECPRQPRGVPYDFDDVFKVALSVFSGARAPPFNFHERWDEFINSRSGERWLERRSTRDKCSLLASKPECKPRDSEALHPSEYERETRTMLDKDPSQELEDRELEDLTAWMGSLPVCDALYIVLYDQCTQRFPEINLPNPDLSQVMPSLYAQRTSSAPPPPIRLPWPRISGAIPAPPSLPSANSPSSSFPSHRRTETCAFCAQPGHRIRQCPTVREYIHAGRAVIKDDRIHLPVGQPIPSDDTGRGLQSAIDAWLAKSSY